MIHDSRLFVFSGVLLVVGWMFPGCVFPIQSQPQPQPLEELSPEERDERILWMRMSACDDLRILTGAAMNYYRDKGKLPADIWDIKKWIETDLKRRGVRPRRYWRLWIRDYWGHLCSYEKLSETSFRIISYGQDGKPGGEGNNQDIIVTADAAAGKAETMGLLLPEWKKYPNQIPQLPQPEKPHTLHIFTEKQSWEEEPPLTETPPKPGEKEIPAS